MGLLMDAPGTRALTSLLADDLGWLEKHYRQQPELGLQASELRLAAALVRNCLGPFLDDQPAKPLHIVVVGGAGAGKSTVANMLSGAAAAEANPQAGFTRHPVAYTSGNGTVHWTGHLGLLGPLQRLPQPGPASIDADVYQVRHVDADRASLCLLKDVVVWDCPDMTTWAATGYVPRLLEAAALADVIVYVASDERYNDEVPTQFLRLLLLAGKPVIVCLMKMKEAEAPAILADFKQKVASTLPGVVVDCLAIPHLSPQELSDPARLAGRFRIPLLNQVGVLSESAGDARNRSVSGASHYLSTSQARLLGGVKSDVEALATWRTLVQSGRREFEDRYRREYLTSEKFRRFDEALVRLIDLLEMPGVGKFISGTLWVLRTPYRLVKGLLGKAFIRPDTPSLPEQPVLEQALAGWLDMLHKEAARRADVHSLWAHVERGFGGDLPSQARERLQQSFREFQLSQADEVERTAREIYEELEKNPVALNTLRGGKFAMEVAAIAATVASAGINWHDFILVPLAASVTQHLVEWLGKQYVDNQREQARRRQQTLMAQHIAAPLGEWLAQWPATGGSAYERLELAMRRLPETVRELEAAVKQRMMTTTV
jgi:hypothetical protein